MKNDIVTVLRKKIMESRDPVYTFYVIRDALMEIEDELFGDGGYYDDDEFVDLPEIA